MPDPFDLPPELLAQVLDDALAGCNSQQQCRFIHVNRQWRAVIEPKVYSKWMYNGVIHSFESLWSFLLTVLRNSQLAALVRTLHIGNWGYKNYIAFDRRFDHPVDDWDLVRKSLHDVGLGSLETQIHRQLSQGDRRPIMALLFTSLPNVSVINAHVPPSDPVMGIVLEKSLAQQSENLSSAMLRNLTQVRLLSEVVPETGGIERPLQLGDVWPILLLPSIRSISFLELDTEGASTLLADKRSLGLQNLAVIHSRTSKATAGDIQTLLAVPDALKSFSIFLNDWYYMGPRKHVLQLSNPDLCNALKKHH